MTEQEIDAAKSARGGWTRATLAKWGVPLPPPKGWRRALLRGEYEETLNPRAEIDAIKERLHKLERMVSILTIKP